MPRLLARLAPIPAADLAGLWHVIARTGEASQRERFAVTCDYRPRADGGFDLTETCRRGSLGGEVEVMQARVSPLSDGRLAVARRGSLAGALPFLRLEERHALINEDLCLIWDPLRATARLLSRPAHPAGYPLPEAEALLGELGLPVTLERAVQP